MDLQFNIGDIVRLQTGGTKMNIINLRCETHAECVWHDGLTPHKEIYPLAILVRESLSSE